MCSVSRRARPRRGINAHDRRAPTATERQRTSGPAAGAIGRGSRRAADQQYSSSRQRRPPSRAGPAPRPGSRRSDPRASVERARRRARATARRAARSRPSGGARRSREAERRAGPTQARRSCADPRRSTSPAPASAIAQPTPSSARHAQHPHLGLHASRSAPARRRAPARRPRARRGSPRTPPGCGRNSSAREHEHDPVARRAGPLQVREVAAGVLEQRPLVDHRELEVGVGVVDRLAPGLDEDHERERDRAAPVRRACPRYASRRAAWLIARRSVLCDGQRGRTSSASTQQRLAEHGDHQVPRGAHQARSRCRCPTQRRGSAKRASASTPTSTSASLPEPASSGRARRPARSAVPTSRHAATSGGASGRRSPVPLRVDRALAPQPAQVR